MSAWLQTIIDRAAVVESPELLTGELARIIMRAGFDFFTYLHLHANGIDLVSNAPKEWQAWYLERASFTTDPMIALARARKRLFVWDLNTLRRLASKCAWPFLDEADRQGMRFGLSIPIEAGFGHIAMLTLTSATRELSLDPADESMATTAVAGLHARYQSRTQVGRENGYVRLSPLQTVCLRWLCEGKSIKTIATIEGTTYADVAFHLRSAQRALGANSIAQAITNAKMRRLI